MNYLRSPSLLAVILTRDITLDYTFLYRSWSFFASQVIQEFLVSAVAYFAIFGSTLLREVTTDLQDVNV